MPLRLIATQVLNHQVFVFEKAQIDLFRRRISGSHSTGSILDKHTLLVMTEGEPIKICKKSKDLKTVRGWAHPGMIDFIPAGTYVEAIAEGETEYEYAAILIDPVTLDTPHKPLTLRPILNGEDLLIYQAVKTVMAACQQPSEHMGPFVNSVIEMLLRYITYSYSTSDNIFELPSEGLTTRQIQMVVKFVEENLSERLKLEELSDLVGRSPFHFSRQFKRAMGMTPHQYVLDRRISCAKEMLKEPDVSIGGIAYDLGFSNQSHFSSVFKKLAGVSPRSYRKGLVD